MICTEKYQGLLYLNVRHHEKLGGGGEDFFNNSLKIVSVRVPDRMLTSENYTSKSESCVYQLI